MRIFWHAILEALDNLRRERRRLFPMAMGIVWGMASVMVLLAIAAGFEKHQRAALAAYGDRFILLRLNRAELDRSAGGEERRLMMDARDIDRLRRGAPAIRRVSPMNNAYRARITGANGAGADVWACGALPEIAQLRNMPLAEGRFYHGLDEAQRRRVIVLGPQARTQLFGSRPALGRTVRITGFSTAAIAERTPATPTSGRLSARPAPDAVTPRAGATPAELAASTVHAVGAPVSADSEMAMEGETFEVIGVLADIELRTESYVSVARMAFVPFSTACAIFEQRFNTIYIEPRSLADHDLALRQFKQVMGARYGFSPDDQNAVLIYFDALERARTIQTIFGGFKLFLAAVGVLILAIGGIGVMNVVLVSVAARRFEIGLRKALGATPRAIYLHFFIETVAACLASGLLGFLLGAAGIALLAAVPLPEGFSRPALDLDTAALAFGLLSAIAVTVAVVPARRAAQLPPIEALRSAAA